jgi:hypothetical protein
MMADTPRAFVGSVAFQLLGPVSSCTADAVHAALAAMPGIGSCDLDERAGVLVVTARAPTDRVEVVALLRRLGCPVRA